MGNFWILTKKELSSYFNSPIAYIFICIFLIVGNWLFMQNLFLIKMSSLRYYFDFIPWMFLFLIPALTMRLWAEEKGNGTEEILLTLPLKEWEIVLSKYFSSLALMLILLVGTFTLPITLSIIGAVDWGVIAGNYLGMVFFGAACLSVGVFISSLTKNQIVSFLITALLLFVLILIGTPIFTSNMPNFLIPVAKQISLFSHFDSFSKGIIDIRDLFYYLSVAALFLLLNKKSIESRNW